LAVRRWRCSPGIENLLTLIYLAILFQKSWKCVKPSACIEEVAYRMGFISKGQILQAADELAKSGYGNYLKMVLTKSGL